MVERWCLCRLYEHPNLVWCRWIRERYGFVTINAPNYAEGWYIDVPASAVYDDMWIGDAERPDA